MDFNPDVTFVLLFSGRIALQMEALLLLQPRAGLRVRLQHVYPLTQEEDEGQGMEILFVLKFKPTFTYNLSSPVEKIYGRTWILN